MNNKVVIIGAGLGGLECGYILAKNGMQVTVLEHDTQIGGCLQSFRRGKQVFDAGFHYVGGLREGESLHGLFKYFNLLDLPWQQLDEDCFDEVVIGNQSFPFANGHNRFAERLAQSFPKERANLRKYVALLKKVGDALPESFAPRETEQVWSESLFARSAYQFLCETIQDPLLRKVLSGTSLKMELDADTLPLYVFAQINNSFLQSSWRLRGGGQQLTEHLAESIRQMGGTVRVNSTVTSIVERGGKAIGVRVNREEFIEADYVISNQHPQALLNLMADSQVIRPVYRKRIGNLQQTFGMFTANIRLKPDTLPYLNKNLYIHNPQTDLWHVDTSKVNGVLVSYYTPQTEDTSYDSENRQYETGTISQRSIQYAPAIDLLTPLRWSQVARWDNTPQGRRGDDYVQFKQQKTEECLNFVEQRLPELRGAIDRVFTSSPLSYNYYVKAHQGTAYGIRKDYNRTLTTILTPRTPLPNLFLTGQNLNLHGILGVSMTSVFTCAEMLGMEFLREQLDVKHWK